MDLIFKGEIRNNKLRIFEQSKLTNLIHSLNNNRVELILRKETKKRSISANSYYWAVIVELFSKHLGYEADEMHEILKYKMLGYDVMEINGEKVIKIRSTRHLTTDEFQNYIQKCIRWGNSLGIEFPSPDEVYIRR